MHIVTHLYLSQQVFAYFGTPGNQASSLPLLIPILWVSKLRQLRLITKFASYLWLQLLPRLDFLLPLFPAPLQVVLVIS